MKKLTGLDKALIFVAIFVALFTITMIVTFWFKEDVPNVLITAVFGATFAECGFCSYIWKAKNERGFVDEGLEKEGQDESRVIENINRDHHNDNGFSLDVGCSPISEEQTWKRQV